MAGRELGPGPHGRRVVGAARLVGLGRPGAAADCVRPGPVAQRRRAGAAGASPTTARSALRAASACCSPRRRSPRTARRSRSSATSARSSPARRAWCQLFSEPGAGSDLAGLGSQGRPDGDEWVVNGQKVWTSGGHIADMGMLIARTEPDAPKHQGITWFACRHAPAAASSPAAAGDDRPRAVQRGLPHRRPRRRRRSIGRLNNGWAVANTTLAYERAGLGAGGGSAAASAGNARHRRRRPRASAPATSSATPPGWRRRGGSAGRSRCSSTWPRRNGTLTDPTSARA